MNKYFEEDRLIIILKQIQNNNCISLNSISEYLNVSTRTVKNDIKLLNDLFENYAFIEGEQGSFRLYIINKDEFDIIKNTLYKENKNLDTPKKRMVFIFKKLISTDAYISIEELAFDMNTGRTTLIGDIKNLNNKLKTYSLSIEGKTNSGIKLNGTEFNIRYFILENIYDIFFIENEDNMILNSIIDYVSEQYNLEDITKIAFKKNISILLHRVEKGYCINELSEKYYLLENNIKYPIIQLIATELENLFSIKLTKEECLFMAIPIVSMRTPTNIESIKALGISDEIKSLIQNICTKIKYDLNISFDYNKLNDEFFYHITFMINRLHLGYSLKNPILKEMKEQYKLAYNMASIAGEVISEAYDITVSDDELGYITAYFGAYILNNKITQNIYSVGIICNAGRGTAILILSHLKLIFDKTTTYELYSSHKIDVETLEQHDIIFTNYKLDINTKIPRVPIVEIKDIFNEQQIKLKIEKELQLYNYKTEHITKRTEVNSIIASLINYDKIFILDDNKSYTKNLHNMIDTLYSQNYVDKDFKKRIIEREKKSVMIFDRFVAFPHTTNKKSDEVIISVGVSNTGVALKDNGHKIKIIFLLSLPEQSENDGIILRIYDEIISIAQNKNSLEAISSSKDSNEVLRNFIKLGSGGSL